jgi:Protein of unknown function (DUF998)
MSSNQFRKLSAWAGILAPIIFVGVFIVEGAIRKGYDPRSMYISALSLGNRGWIQIANFMVLGLLLFIFTLGLSKEFQTGKASRGGIITFYIISVLFFISGPFVMDPVDTPANQMSVHGLIHGISGGIVFLLMPIIIFIFLRRFISDVKWQSFRGWTLILGIIEALGVIAFTYVSKIPAEQNAYVNLLGLFQRIALIPFMVWVCIFGIEMLRRQR